MAIPGDGAVSLAPLRPEDVDAAYLAWLADPVVTRFTEVRGVQDLASVRAYVAAAVAAPDAAMWRIDHAGRHVGNVRLSGITRRHRRAIVALMVGDRAVWGRGVASAAIALVAGHAFAALGLHKLTAGIYAGHTASRRAFEKAGFHCEATLRDHVLFEGSFVDVLQMARFASGPA